MNWVFRDYAEVYDVAMFGAWRGQPRKTIPDQRMPEETVPGIPVGTGESGSRPAGIRHLLRSRMSSFDSCLGRGSSSRSRFLAGRNT